MRVNFDQAKIDVWGEKKNQDSKVIDYIEINMIIKNPSDEEKLRKAAELGTKYCSIHELISRSANIVLNVTFN